MFLKRCTLLLCLVFSVEATAQAIVDRSRQITLASGELVLASEGDREPRSIGSIALRIYAAASEKFPYDNFVAGLVRSREGALEDLLATDLDDDGSEEIVVVFRSAGSGGYVSAEAFRFSAEELTLIAAVSFLESNADPVQALRQEISD